jgi:hypothetical protein
MPGKTTSLAIRIVSDGRDAAKGFKEAEDRVGGFQRGLDRASIAAGAVAVGIAAAAREAYQAASDLQQSTGGTEAVFGAQAAAIQDYAKKAASAVGLSKNSYQELANVLGAQLKNMGVSTDQLVPKVNDLVKLGADLSATYGGTAADAVSALSSLLKGETDPIERYGVSIKQSDINTQLAAMGLDKLTGAAAKQAQAQAVLALLSQQTSSAVGQWAAQLGTASEAQQVATAEWENAKASLGEALLPALTTVNGLLADFASWATQNSGTVQTLALVIGGLAIAILAVNAGVKAYEAAAVVATAAQWLWNVALTANPLGIIIVAIAAIVGLIIWAADKMGGFGEVFKAVGNIFKTVGGWIMDHVLQPIVDLIGWVVDHLSWIGDAASWVGDLFSAPAGGGGGGGGAAGAPMRGAARGLGPAPMRAAPAGAITGSGGPSSGGGGGGGGDTINITINGALDPVEVGNQVQGVLDRRDKNTGRKPPLAAGRGAR